MLNLQKLLVDGFVEEIKVSYVRTYGFLEPDNLSILEWASHLALEIIANCDALYHNIEHTIMITLVGQEILKGKHLSEGGVTPKDWLHFTIALLCHDIGFVRGICRNDRNNLFDSGVDGKLITLPPGATDASLNPYHVDRGKLFIRERFGGKLLFDMDMELIINCIEMTRFPIPPDDFYKDTSGYPGLTRAADLIGQLGDPNYLRKIPALFYEFEETGINKKMNYKNPDDVRRNYAGFYWNVVYPYIQDALKYLRVTQEGKQWISNLHSQVFAVEHVSENKKLFIEERK